MAMEGAYFPDFRNSGTRNSSVNSWLAEAHEKKIPESTFTNDDDVIPGLAYADQITFRNEKGKSSPVYVLVENNA